MLTSLFKEPAPVDLERLRAALMSIYPAPVSETALQVEMFDRPHWFMARYAAWIDSVLPLAGASMLEIGVGTGASAISYAERGANVVGVDIDTAALGVAQVRASIYGVAERVEFHAANAVEIGTMFESASFDIVIFSASLEHMSHAERMSALKAAWAILRPGGYLSIVDSPNRLWFFDNHTAMANFYHWLPNDLALAYAKRTPRSDFNCANLDELGLARWGRGVSYHDIEVAIDLDVRDMTIFGEWDFRREAYPDWATGWRETPNGRYHELLKLISPDIPAHFLEEEIAMMIQKP